MKDRVLRIYGVITVAFALVVIGMILTGNSAGKTESMMLAVNNCNVAIWFVISYWARRRENGREAS